MLDTKLIHQNLLLKEQNLSQYATKSSDAFRLEPDDEDFRPPFFRDTDRIIHAFSYSRYLAKTQVYSFQENDHVTRRMLHVQLVSKISRTIGRALNLNEDLIEAIALGHDIGHTPLGHTGEAILNKLSQKYLHQFFAHNLQSVRNYMILEHNGKGLNLNVQVLDGIMCHNGEKLQQCYEPKPKDIKMFLKEFQDSYHDKDVLNNLCAMTLEGCVVRLSDVIAYIGRDLEDAIILKKIKRTDIPSNISKVLGNNNRDIINNLIIDVINNSFDNNYIKLSDSVYDALNKLQAFNYQYIYCFANSEEDLLKYEQNIVKLYETYLHDLNTHNITSNIYTSYLNTMDESYINNTSNGQMVLDYIAGMTDNYLMHELQTLQTSKSID